MDRLTPLDAAFLELEAGDDNATLSIASIAVLEGPPPSQREFAEALASRLPAFTRHRHKVRSAPFGLAAPGWVVDRRFDLGMHLHRDALPAPGNETALCELMGEVMSERLDRAHPLWECRVVEGLADGRWALLCKLHHSVADGLAATALHSDLVDGAHQDEPVRPAPARPIGLAHRIGDAVRGSLALAGALLPAAPSSLVGPLGKRRAYEVAHGSLPEVTRTAHALGVTVNDVVLAAISGALRELLISRGERPVHTTARTLVPVSVRTGNGLGNQISLLLPLLPVDLADPVERLNAVHRRLTRLKRAHESAAGAVVIAAAKFSPYAPIGWGLRAAARLPQRSIVTVTTNVPGPRRRLSLLGREVVEVYPYVPIALRLRTGIAVLSYGDRLSFGITTDRDNFPETGFLAKAVERELAALVRT